MDELAVGRDAVDHRVAIGEVAVQLAEGDDLGRADEGEILRPEEYDLPLAGVGLSGDFGECGVEVEALGPALHGLEVELREGVANRQHA